MPINEFLQDMQSNINGADLADAIEGISVAMRSLSETRLKRDTIITLIHAKSKVPKKEIELVLNNLEGLSEIWLKPKQTEDRTMT